MLAILTAIILWWAAMFGPPQPCTIAHSDTLTPAQLNAWSHLTYDFPRQVPVLRDGHAIAIDRAGLDCRPTRTIQEDEVILQ